MKQYMINLAKRIYLNTPSRTLRRLYFDIFCSMVRSRSVHTSIDEIHYVLDLGEVVDLSLYLNRYEPDVTAAIEKYCRPGFTVLDIGANIGAHALPMARRVGESGRVYAFEPTDYAYRKLVKNISLNHFKNVHPMQLVLSDSNIMRQSIHFRSSWPTKGNPKTQESKVDFVRLDDWYKHENCERIDLIKLDVDGNEYSVIMGSKTVLGSQRPPIIMEVWGPNFSDPLKNPFIILQQLGYRFFHITTGEEYASIEELVAPVSCGGRLLDSSFSIIALC